PLTAADLARAVGVRMHAIGVGSEGEVTVPLPNGQRVRLELPINEEELKKMAESTGGSYFRATDAKALQEIFRKIDGMERTKVEVLSYGRYEELFAWFLVPALVLMGAGYVGSRTLLAKVPYQELRQTDGALAPAAPARARGARVGRSRGSPPPPASFRLGDHPPASGRRDLAGPRGRAHVPAPGSDRARGDRTRAPAMG